MSNTPVPGYSDVWGKHGAWSGDHTGPASYTTGGETLGQASNSYGGVNQFGLRNIDNVVGSVSDSGTYYVLPQFTGTGTRTQFKLLWFVVASGAQVGAAVNLSTETVRLLIIGG